MNGVSRHALVRIRERLGVTRFSDAWVANWVLRCGRRARHFEGARRAWIERLELDGSRVRVWRRWAFLYRERVLVTVLHLPRWW